MAVLSGTAIVMFISIPFFERNSRSSDMLRPFLRDAAVVMATEVFQYSRKLLTFAAHARVRKRILKYFLVIRKRFLLLQSQKF